jgi:hypothetical protein
MGIYYDRVISRPFNCMIKDAKLKQTQLRYLFNLPQYQKVEKIFYDDNDSNLEAIYDLGARVVDAKGWRKKKWSGNPNLDSLEFLVANQKPNF